MSAPQALPSRDRDILDALPAAVCVLDINLAIPFWNNAAERLYGWSRKEAIGQNLTELLQCVYDERLVQGLEQLLNVGTLHRRDGIGRLWTVPW